MTDARDATVPNNDLSLARIHATMDRMSQADTQTETVKHRRQDSANAFPEDGHDNEDTCPKGPGISELVKEALATTGKLWKRRPMEILS